MERLGIDILPVKPAIQFFGLRRENWKPWKLWDGTDVLVPGQFNVEVDEEGNWLLHSEGDPNQPVEGKMLHKYTANAPRNIAHFGRKSH